MSKFDKLPDDVKIKLMFNQWIMWADLCDFGKDKTDPDEHFYNFPIDYYAVYRNFRFECVDYICNYDLHYSDIPDVSVKNQNDVFKMCRKYLDLKELADE